MQLLVSLTVVMFAVAPALAAPPAAASKPLPAALTGVSSILFLGDSLTDGSSFPDYVVNTINGAAGTKIRLMNAGICGDTAAMLLARLKADVLDRKPDMVVVCIGTNDCHQNRPVDKFQAEMEKLVDALEAAKIRVVLVRPSPFGKPEMEKRFEGYLKVIDDLAAARKLTAANVHDEFVRQMAEGKDMLGADGIHHGKDGFPGKARAVLDALGFKDTAVDLQIKPWPNTLTTWEIAEPIAADLKAAMALDPNAAAGWKAFDANAAAAALPWHDAPFAQRGAVMPLVGLKPAKPSFAFARTTYKAAEACKAQLVIGGSPGIVVWVNGKEAWRNVKPHGYHPEADRVAVDLVAGDNTIIVLTNFMAFIGVEK